MRKVKTFFLHNITIRDDINRTQLFFFIIPIIITHTHTLTPTLTHAHSYSHTHSPNMLRSLMTQATKSSKRTCPSLFEYLITMALNVELLTFSPTMNKRQFSANSHNYCNRKSVHMNTSIYLKSLLPHTTKIFHFFNWLKI